MTNFKKNLAKRLAHYSEARQKKDIIGTQKCYGLLYEPQNPLVKYSDHKKKLKET